MTGLSRRELRRPPHVTITALEGRLEGHPESDGDALNDADNAFWQGWDDEDE